MISDQLITEALKKAKGKKVHDIRLGLGYICTILEDQSAGLAYTFRNELGNCCGALHDAGNLIGKNSEELILWIKEKNVLKSAIGLATINAACNQGTDAVKNGNVMEALKIKATEGFGMVGNFSPLLAQAKKMTENIFVFERQPEEGSGLYPESAMPRLLPRCDVIVITATSIINHTIDGILPHCQNAREVCIVGPSTPLCPGVFQDTPVTLLAGSIVTDVAGILPIISQGGGTKEMKKCIQHVLLKF